MSVLLPVDNVKKLVGKNSAASDVGLHVHCLLTCLTQYLKGCYSNADILGEKKSYSVTEKLSCYMSIHNDRPISSLCFPIYGE